MKYPLIIIVTNQCNLDCKYCAVLKKNIFINKSIAFKAIDLYLCLLGDNKGKIKIFGGEPLLKIDLLKNIIAYVRKKSHKIDIELCTNGVLLDDNIFSWLKENKVNLSISIDGDKTSQMLNRKGISPQTYQKTINLIKNNQSRVIVNMVIAPNTVDKFFQNFVYVHNLGVKGFNFLPAAYRPWSFQKIKILERQLNFVSEFLKKHREIYVKNVDIDNDLFFFNTGMVVDCNGDVFFTNAIMLKEFQSVKKKFKISNIKDNNILECLKNLDFHKEINKIELNTKELFDHKILQSNKAIDNTLNNFVDSMKNKSNIAEKEGLKLKENKRIDIKIGYQCNNHCCFCVQGDKRKKCLFRKKSEIIKELIQAKESCQSVVFTGGEPTIHPNFLDLIRRAKKLGYQIIQVQTNGRMFAYKEFCRKTIEAGANEFSPAVHGHTGKLHDYLTNVKGSFDQTIQGIKNLKSLNQRVITNTVITKFNYRYLPKIAKLLVDLNVDQFQFAFVHIAGAAWKNRKLIVPKKSEIMPYVKKGLDIGIKAGKRVMTEAIPYCFMKDYEKYIAEQIIPDAMVVEDMFKIDDYKKYRVNRGKSRGSNCKKCDFYSICEGPWREYPEIFGWKEFKPVIKKKNSPKKNYELYKNFLKDYKPYYNIFFLADLMHWVGEKRFVGADLIRKKWESHIHLIKNKKVNDVLNFYIHIPFCESKCSYCMYYSEIANKEKLEDYIKNLIKQIKFFKNTFTDAEFSSLYIGGGTPSILSEKQLSGLLSILFRYFKFKEDGEKTFESNPQSISIKKLKLLKQFGFNRISMGVQTFNNKVRTYTKRNYGDYKFLPELISKAKEFGFEVNTDIMVGLKNDTAEIVVDSFIELTKMRPDTITIYPLKPTQEYLEKYCNNNYCSFNKKLNKKAGEARQKLKSMEDKLEYYIIDKGFEIFSSAEPVFYNKNFKASYKYDYDYTSPINFSSPCSLFALGTRASSYIFNSSQHHLISREKSFGFNPNEKNYWALEYNLKDEMRYFILQQLSCRLCFSQKSFKKFFNADFKTNFKEAINSLKKLNKIKFKGDLVFLPTDPLERYACSLFFFDEKKVYNLINKSNAL
ncbi:radical SAM protein [Patescibacteria group bacterium]|nr:radical SAM protein [Patescibacteria group bacterium]